MKNLFMGHLTSRNDIKYDDDTNKHKTEDITTYCENCFNLKTHVFVRVHLDPILGVGMCPSFGSELHSITYTYIYVALNLTGRKPRERC